MTAPLFSAVRLAELLAPSGTAPLIPTPEQQRVIEQPIHGSALVIAGAGSGKTETMANRVVWLLANRFVNPEQVLGLTFTRKAAGELLERVVGRIERFASRLQDAAERGELSAAEAQRARELHEVLDDGLRTPEISTYDSFAAAVLQEFGSALGIAPGAVIIDAATAWRVAREVVLTSTDPDLVRTTMRVPELIRHTIALDHAIADHFASPHRVARIAEEFQRVLDLPYSETRAVGGTDGRGYAPVRAAAEKVALTPLLSRLAEAFATEKHRRGLMEFSDQLAFAERTITESADAALMLRDRYPVILLDEVQDTSVGQTEFLSKIFAGSAVMAVGDPHQSIYGWRGASAAGLETFHRDFGRTDGSGIADGVTLSLSTSWRNPDAVLTAANRVVAPLAAESPIDVPELVSRPGAARGTIEWRYPETIGEEFAELAQWMADERNRYLAEEHRLPTAAVILRNRRHMGEVSAALTAAGVPNRIVGLGGLLTTPEVTDLVSALRCVWYAEAGSDLIRLLAGPRFRIGVADLEGLRTAARWFGERDVSQRRLGEADRESGEILPDPDRAFTIIDALDQIAQLRDQHHSAVRHISETGFARLQEAGRMLARLRQGIPGGVLELIHLTVRALRLDIELEANETRPHDGGAAALANIDAFLELAAEHLAVDARGTLASLLEWVERARESDEAEEQVPPPAPGTVQLITIHGAKGLEWDVVAVPRLVIGEFPGGALGGVGWLRTGQLPDELRGDAMARPQLNWRIAATQQELRDRIADYESELKERQVAEERRLAYVALTRSAGRLLLTGSFWAGHTRPRHPSPFLGEIAETGIISGLPEASAHETDPSEEQELTMRWPLDPLGRRRGPVLRAAERVRAAQTSLEERGAGLREALPSTLRALLAERSAALESTGSEPELPERITASSFHEFIADPEAAERGRLRPVPQRPYRRTRIGNRFHEWVERRATTPVGTSIPLLDLAPDAESDSRDELDDAADLQALIEVFERSRWADRAPEHVELEVTIPFAGRTLVCKLDAVYPQADGRWEIVDWKAGQPPRDERERELRFFQLDLYRQAFARWAGIAPERVDVTLFYVAAGVELSGGALRTLDELEAAWKRAAAELRPVD